MRICQVMGGDEEGGLEKHFVDLCNSLAQRHQVRAIAHPKYASRFADNVDFIPLDLARSRRSPGVLWALRRHIRQFHPDIVHAQANKAAHMVATLRRLIPGRKVATLHNQGKNLGIFRRFDAVISVSQVELERLPLRNKHLIYNGVDPEIPHEVYDRAQLHTEFGLPTEGPLFGAVGRFVPAKGFDLLLDAWREIDAPLLLIGDGPEKDRLQALIHDFGLTGRVRLAGYRQDVPSLLSSIDALVISSRREGFPYLMVEALILGTPIIATAVSGCRDILPDSALVAVADVAALRRRIQTVAQDTGAFHDSYADTFAYAARDLTADAMAGKTEAVYRELL